MKLLRNPVVVAILAVAAIALVTYQTMGAKYFRRGFAEQKLEIGSAKPAPPAPATPAPTKPGTTATVPPAIYTNLDAALMPSQGVETAKVERQFKTWVSAPLRDPFLLFKSAAEDPAVLLTDTNSPVPTWTLTAIWNQTGSRLAVINTGTNGQSHQRVYQAGDVVIENYKVFQIEKDEVWIQGPRANERLAFSASKTRVAPTNAPAVTTKSTP